MHEKLFNLIKDNVGIEFLTSQGVYNIFPKHVPDGAIDGLFSSACTYNFNQGTVNKTVTLYSVQINVFNLNYSECRRISLLIKTLFNNKDYTDEQTGYLTSNVTDILELPFDTETGMYGVAVNLVIKTALEW